MKKVLFSLIASSLLLFNLSSAQADPTYAVLDSNGNVTNIIVCGSACASGEFDGNKVVLQVAADPVTSENRGGVWQGAGTTIYNENTGIFTVTQNTPTLNSVSIVETDNNSEITSSVTIEGTLISTFFKYEDTIGDNLFIKKGWIYNYSNDTRAQVNVNKDNITESLDFETRKTNNEVTEIIQNSNLILLNSKIQVLISLLGSWIK
jgi:hypothetical protein